MAIHFVKLEKRKGLKILKKKVIEGSSTIFFVMDKNDFNTWYDYKKDRR